jgi:glycosyltransferase involved in cell wall biosynthesis
MSICVIISTYDSPESLDKVLLAYSVQSKMPNEIIIAEDGQNKVIANIALKWKGLMGIDILHISQQDIGFRKNRILNKAIKLSTSKQLIFTDQDILPRLDFVENHMRLLKPGTFISGGSHLNINRIFHKTLDDLDIINQQIFSTVYLKYNQQLNFSKLRLTNNQYLAKFLDMITPRCAFVGCNSSVLRENLIKIGGFDESMKYGGEDLNLGIRLNNLGCQGKRYKYSLVCLHLDHSRSYTDEVTISQNESYNKKVKREKLIKPSASFLQEQTKQ